MKIKFLTVIVSFTILFSCNKKNKDPESLIERANGYIISGTIPDVPDSTVVYLSKPVGGTQTTWIQNNSFEFQGFEEEPTIAYLVVEGYRNGGFAPVWLENTDITITANKNSIKNAVIEGSFTQKEQDVFNKRVDKISNEQVKLYSLMGNDQLQPQLRDSILIAIDSLEKQRLIVSKDFIKEFPKSHVSANILALSKMIWDKQDIRNSYALLSEEIKNSKQGKTIAYFLSLPDKPEIGEKYIDFSQPDQDGNEVKLSDIKGNYILVEFWSSWCVPCRRSNPKLIENYHQYKDQGFEIIGVSLDEDKKAWTKAIKDDHLPWTQVSDLKGFNNEAALIYGVNAIPDNFIIDSEGVIVARTLRGILLEDKLKELFN
ncbi:redoxin domain-containing protein [Aquimarina sp. SS2-1]|uniref:redoxin domain-containing protein n=1 Tax=Aquimarina besae TaxID=3342247 RepID=UPI0036704E32